MKSILLCRPCAEQLKTQKKVTIGASLRDKNTCEVCGKRRFVYNCSKEPYARISTKNEEIKTSS